MAWWLWVSLAFLMIIAEMFLPAGFVLVFIGLSFLITGVIVALGLTSPIWLQYLICTVSLLTLLFFFRKKIINFFGADKASGYDELIGQEVLIMTDIAAGQTGQGELRGSQWSVRNIGTEALVSGERCKIQNVDGLTIETAK